MAGRRSLGKYGIYWSAGSAVWTRRPSSCRIWGAISVADAGEFLELGLPAEGAEASDGPAALVEGDDGVIGAVHGEDRRHRRVRGEELRRQDAGDREGGDDLGMTGSQGVGDDRPLREAPDEDLPAVGLGDDAVPDPLLGADDGLGEALAGRCRVASEPGVTFADRDEALWHRDVDARGNLRQASRSVRGGCRSRAARRGAGRWSRRRGRRPGRSGRRPRRRRSACDRRADEKEQGAARIISSGRRARRRASRRCWRGRRSAISPSGRTPRPSSGPPSGRSSRHDGKNM